MITVTTKKNKSGSEILNRIWVYNTYYYTVRYKNDKHTERVPGSCLSRRERKIFDEKLNQLLAKMDVQYIPFYDHDFTVDIDDDLKIEDRIVLNIKHAKNQYNLHNRDTDSDEDSTGSDISGTTTEAGTCSPKSRSCSETEFPSSDNHIEKH